MGTTEGVYFYKQTQTLVTSPDYEAELQKKRSSIEQDKYKNVLLLFPPDEVQVLYHQNQYKVKKVDEKLEWYSIYGVESIKDVNILGQKVFSFITDHRKPLQQHFRKYPYLQPVGIRQKLHRPTKVYHF